VSSLDINRAKFRESKIKQLLKFQKDSEQEEDKASRLFDGILKSINKRKDKKLVSGFQFITKGSIIEKAETIRNEVNIKKRAPEKEEATDEFMKMSKSLKQYGIKRTGVKIKHHVRSLD
jgi:hypothetical protein